MTERESKRAQYQAAVDNLCRVTEMVREELTARVAAVAPGVTLPPVGPPPVLMAVTAARALPPVATPGVSEVSSALSPRRMPTRTRDIDNLILRLRAHSSRELSPGLTAGQVADDLEQEAEEIEMLKAIRRYIAEFDEFLDFGLAVLEAALMPRALRAYHEVRRLARLPGGSEYEPLARKMMHALRAQQHNPRGRRA